MSLFLGVLFALSGCEQAEPGASGTITIDPTIDQSQFDTLFIAAVEGPFGSDTPLFDDTVEPVRTISTQIDLDAVDFPYDYIVGGGIGDPSPEETWSVVVRLNNSEEGDNAAGRPIGTAEFIVPVDCRGEFCGIATDVDIEIARE